MDFEQAIKKLREGYKVKRKEWKHGMGVLLKEPDGINTLHEPYFVNFYLGAPDYHVSTWTPSFIDITSNDWEVIE